MLWFVIKLNDKGMYRGDCEDYALSVLYYVDLPGVMA